MKKLLLLTAFVAMSMLAMAQTNQLVWSKGQFIYGTSIEKIDSLTYGKMEESDTFNLLLPHKLTLIDRDTLYLHDTIYVKIPTIGTPDGIHKYVDLGLSVKWATCNIGATQPEEYGNYFAWGEVRVKNDFYWSTYKHCINDYNKLIKYCSKSSYGNEGFTDDKIILDQIDDAATIVWNTHWRMPTNEEFTELLEKCTWEWTTQNGVNGYRVTSNVEGYTDCSIFLPAAGIMFGSNLSYVGTEGVYWSSLLYVKTPSYAYNLYFMSNKLSITSNYRYIGYSIRPVCP